LKTIQVCWIFFFSINIVSRLLIPQYLFLRQYQIVVDVVGLMAVSRISDYFGNIAVLQIYVYTSY